MSEDHLSEGHLSEGHLSEGHLSEDHLSEGHGAMRGSSSGHPQVDAVLRTLDSLSDLPVDQHVAVFEAAHVGLRAALEDARSAAPAHG